MTLNPESNRLSAVLFQSALLPLLVGRPDGRIHGLGGRVVRVQWLPCVLYLIGLRWLGWRSGLRIHRRRFWLPFLLDQCRLPG